MNKMEFVEALRNYGDYTKKDAQAAVDNVLGLIAETVCEGESVTFPGFGKFDVITRGEREARNPRTGETISIPPRKGLKFKVGKNIKDALLEL